MAKRGKPSSVLAVDVGGSHVKALRSGESQRRRFDSGPDLTPQEMVRGVLTLAEGWSFDRVTVGIPTPVRGGKSIAEPVNLGEGWVDSTSTPLSASRRRWSTTR